MESVLVSVLAFTGVFSVPTMAWQDLVLARLDLLELRAESGEVKAQLFCANELQSPRPAPEEAPHPWKPESKAQLAVADIIAAGFAAAIVVAVVLYVRVTRKRAAETHS